MAAIINAPAHLLGVLKHLPAVQYAFAYGSGVHVQPGLYETTGPAGAASSASQKQGSTGSPGGKRPMLDFILAVRDPTAWHAENIKRNEAHYSWVSKLGPAAVAGTASHVGVGVHFNTLVPLGDQMVKYGVVSYDDVLDDLLTWRHIYIAGRLHKPVTTLVATPQMQAACVANVNSAALAALLLLPPRFTTKELLRQVVALSYTGDVRMLFAEDPRKVDRIVEGSWAGLRGMYVPCLATNKGSNAQQTKSGSPHVESATSSTATGTQSQPASGYDTALATERGGQAGLLAGVQQIDEDAWQQAVDADSRIHLISHLPPALMVKVGQQLGYSVPESHCVAGSSTALDLASAVVRSNRHQELVKKAVHDSVRASSVWQAVSGVLAAGGGKAVAYVAAKVEKALQSNASSTKQPGLSSDLATTPVTPPKPWQTLNHEPAHRPQFIIQHTQMLSPKAAIMDGPHLPDMPVAWLSSVALAVDAQLNGLKLKLTPLQLFRTCRRLAQVLCNQLAIRPVLIVKPWDIELDRPMYVKALALIEAAAPARLYLRLESTPLEWLHDMLTEAAQLAQQTQPDQPAAAPVLSCITAITTSFCRDRDLRLHSLVPDFLVQLCPSLEELHFECLIVMASEDAPQLTCRSLRTLSLHGVHFEGNQPSAVLQQQLLNLPSLTALEFDATGRKTQYQPGSALFTAIGRYSSQLRALSLSHPTAKQFWPQGTHFALLQQLKMSQTVIKGDASMQQLLAAAPNLQFVELRSIKGLTASFAHVSPGWRELQLHDVYVAELSKLPFATGALLTPASFWLSGATRVKPSLRDVVAGLALMWTTVRVQHYITTDLHLHVDDLEYLTWVAPLLRYSHRSVRLHLPVDDDWFGPWPDRRALLAALGPHLTCERVTLEWGHWLTTPGSLAELPELLPHVKRFVMLRGFPVDEAVKMAEAAARPFELCPLTYSLNGFAARIREAVQAVGNPLITVVDR